MRFFLIITAFLCWSSAALAAGAYIVDDAGIVDEGKIQSESWYTHGGHSTDIGTESLSYQVLPDTEFGLQAAHTFQPDGQNALLPQVKYQWYKSEETHLSISPVTGLAYTAFQGRTLSPYAYVPLTYEATPDLELDTNLGWAYDKLAARHFLTWGLRENYQITKLVSFGSDVFGRNTKNPGFQAGPHFTVNDNLEFDLIYGRNVYGSGENSGTVGITLVF